MLIDHAFQRIKRVVPLSSDSQETHIFVICIVDRQVELGMKRLVLSSKTGNLPDEQGVEQRVQALLRLFFILVFSW